VLYDVEVIAAGRIPVTHFSSGQGAELDLLPIEAAAVRDRAAVPRS